MSVDPNSAISDLNYSAGVEAAGFRGTIPLVLCLALTVAGCASYRGAPDTIEMTTTDAHTGQTTAVVVGDNCPSDQTVADFVSNTRAPAGITKRSWRDMIIGDCIARADSKYSAFIVGLHKEGTATNLGFDLAAITLTGVGAVASKASANAVSAASTGVIGAGAAINKDLFYQKTIPAIIAQMDANRAEIYGSIKKSEQVDEATYTLTDAQHDIRDYVEAGSIDAAVSKITTSAQQASVDAQGQVKALLLVGVVDPQTQGFRAKLSKCIKGISAANRADLDAIASALHADTQAATYSAARLSALVAVDKLTNQAAVDAAVGALKSTKCKDVS